MIVLFSLFCVVYSESPYDYLRNFTEAFMTGYENPDYVFPYSNCLTPATQTTVTDKIIGILIFISAEDWAQVKIAEGQLMTAVDKAVAACDLNKFFDQVDANKSKSIIS